MSHEHRYSLAGQWHLSSHHQNIKEIRPLSGEEVTQTDHASEQTGDFVTNCSLFEICEANQAGYSPLYPFACHAEASDSEGLSLEIAALYAGLMRVAS